MATRYIVCYGPNVVHFLELHDGESFATGQPHTKEFTDMDQALAFAVKQGYVPPADPDADPDPDPDFIDQLVNN